MAKKILITGKNSYVGTSFIKWMAEHEPETECVEISVRGEEWKQFDFSPFDSVLHVAGIAHQKETPNNKDSYFEVNYKLAIDVASKSYNSGIRHFIFLSSMSVFGMSTGVIDDSTHPNPTSNYGKSKFLAENEIAKIPFEILSIIRPPMIYGCNCKGNYQLLSKMSKFMPIFPNFNNARSMIYIDNLSEFIRIVLIRRIQGLLHPQNDEYVETKNLVKMIRLKNGKKTKNTQIFDPILKLRNVPVFEKVFGTLVYDSRISLLELDYNVVNFDSSVQLSEESCR